MTALASLTEKPHQLSDALPQGAPTGLLGLRKRILDIAITLPLIIFLTPLFILIALAVRLIDGQPILYRHIRCGQGGQHFVLYKFRTMRTDGDAMLDRLLMDDPVARADWQAFRKLRRDPRVTRFGWFLRKSSLDELPQLFNVLKGDMSLVGPRPIIDEELARFGALAPVYEAARPGITGLWQVSGRNETDFATRVALDTAYVRDWSLNRDIALLLKTIPAVLLAKGAY